MFGFLIKWSIDIAALIIVLYAMPGISVDKRETAIVAALVLGLVNAFLRPLIILFTLPLNILSFGLFTLVINGAMFYLVSKLVKGFVITSFWNAFWGALFFSVISAILNLLFKPKSNFSFYYKKTDFRERPPDKNTFDSEGKVIK